MAVGLGSMDMPIPAVAAWEWLNWKFPRAVHAGDTVYARWTLTQKRPPVAGEPTAIVVWRVDVHSADGALCAEGELGASVLRSARAAQVRVTEPAAKPAAGEPASPAASGMPAPRRGRRRRRTPAGDVAKNGPEPQVAVALEAPVRTPVVTPAASARPASGPRRRRRRRSTASAAARNGDAPTSAPPVETSRPPPVVKSVPAPDSANPLTRAIRRLRR